MKSKGKIIIIGQIEDKNHLSGPGVVLQSLLHGLDVLRCNHKFINSYKLGFIKTIKLITTILFTRNAIINVHTFGYKIPYLTLFFGRFNKSNDYYLTMHGINTHEYLINGDIKGAKKHKKIENKIIKNFQNIICVSDFQKDFIKKEFKRTKNVFVLHNCINNPNSKLCKKSHGNILLYTGGFSNRKNPLDALRIFLELKAKSNTEIKLIMCGNILNHKLYEECRKFISDNKLKKDINYIGNLNKKDLNREYKNATFIIAPSLFDTFNMSVLEAMNFGCIPIISDNCGIKDIINNNIGYVFDDISFFKKKNIFSNVEKMSNAAFEKSVQYTYLTMARNYLEIVRSEE